jgi:hypothetical protein
MRSCAIIHPLHLELETALLKQFLTISRLLKNMFRVSGTVSLSCREATDWLER